MTTPVESTSQAESPAVADAPVSSEDTVVVESSEQEGVTPNAEAGEAVDSALDDLMVDDDSVDDDDPVEDAIEDDDSDDEADADQDDEIEDPTDHEQWDDAREALIESGLSEEEVDALPPELALKMGLGRIKPGESATEAKAEDSKPAPETPSQFDVDAATKAVTEKLGSQFDESESKAIAEAMVALVGHIPTGSSGDIAESMESYGKSLEAVYSMIEPILVENAIAPLRDAYPELEDKDGESKVIAEAQKIIKRGVNEGDTIADVIELAAAKLFGKEQSKRIRQHNKKVEKARRNGTASNPSNRLAEKEQDPVDAALDALID